MNSFEVLKERILNIRGIAYVLLLLVAIWTFAQFIDDMLDLANRLYDSETVASNAQKVLRPIYFKFDSAELIDESRERLNEYADLIKSLNPIRVIVEGHSRERTAVEYNVNLSQRRARTVQDGLVAFGVDPTSIETRAYGAERPLQGKEPYSPYNDRVEIRLEE